MIRNGCESPTSRYVGVGRAQLSTPSRAGERVAFGCVYTRAIRLARIRKRAAFLGRPVEPPALPAMVTSPAILVAWEFVPDPPPVGRVDCGFGPVAPREVFIQPRTQAPDPRLQPLATYGEPRRIRVPSGKMTTPCPF